MQSARPCLVYWQLNETGEYPFGGRAGHRVDVGKYVVMGKRQEGEWRIYRDIWICYATCIPGMECNRVVLPQRFAPFLECKSYLLASVIFYCFKFANIW